jgi:zinc protease
VCDSSLPFAANVVRLDNGLRVVHQEMRSTPVVVVDVWVKAGALREPEHWSGMAHFLEHMIFKGTEQILPGMFDQVIESRGGATNAATSYDYAHFYMTLAATDLPEALPYLAELLLHPALPADEFGRERQVVLEEILQSWDDPDHLGFQALSALLYPEHPYGRPILGTPEILQARSPEDMRQFHRAYYQPDNMIVVITGNVSKDLALEMVQRSFRTFAAPMDCPISQVPRPQTLQQKRRRVMPLPRLEQGRLMMAWLGPGIDQLEKAVGLDLLAVLLTGGRTSRLVRELREEKQWVQDISGGFSLQQDCSLLTLSVWLEPDRVDAVESLIAERMAQLAEAPITTLELARCQRLLCNDYAFSTETPGQLAGLYGYYGTLAQPELAVCYPDYVKAYTREDLQHMAQTYLNPEHYAAIVLEPSA